ncbi:MAG: anti-sigma factor antagonist [Lachnospiraceae bacterium]|nr:STAS domain-containing protein [Candidatus Fimimorpha excrementavium]
MEQQETKNDQVMYRTAGTSLIIILPPEVDDHNCKGIARDTEEYIKSRVVKRMVFDFTKTGFMDSAGIGVLLGRYKRMRELGGEVVVTGEDQRIERILKISGIYQIIRRI